jgi:hypothetical protein
LFCIRSAYQLSLFVLSLEADQVGCCLIGNAVVNELLKVYGVLLFSGKIRIVQALVRGYQKGEDASLRDERDGEEGGATSPRLLTRGLEPNSSYAAPRFGARSSIDVHVIIQSDT